MNAHRPNVGVHGAPWTVRPATSALSSQRYVHGRLRISAGSASATKSWLPAIAGDRAGLGAPEPLGERALEPPALVVEAMVADRAHVAGDQKQVARRHVGQEPVEVGGRCDAGRQADGAA